jgi:hypothetical protein
MPMDFSRQVSRQLGFLARSCELFDLGFKDEAIRIATTLRVLFHQTGSSTSLLMHLNAVPNLVSTVEPDPHPTFPFQTNLTYIAFNPWTQLHETIPRGIPGYGTRLVPFATWWDREIIYVFAEATERFELTRRKLVLVAANKDGGAHVDHQLDRVYDLLEQGAGASITFNPDNGPSRTVTLANGHLAALRQIGAEVLESEDILILQGSYRGVEQRTPTDLNGAKIIRWCREIQVWDYEPPPHP